jgi:2OG-Fe(II) oxygenase superfamily
MTIGALRPYDRDELRARFRSAQPFPYLQIDNFLDPELAKACVDCYPTYDEARGEGREFAAVNERLKVQICDAAKFKAPVSTLNQAVASPEFLGDLEYITGIPRLLADDMLDGGGMHVMGGSGGRLDVHVDFNYMESRQWHRRLNILIYLNPVWDKAWGGSVEFWNTDVTRCEVSLEPVLNRCVIFETSDISYHGVSPLTAPPGKTRNSFAAYYYTREAPAGWTGTKHSTVFRARPTERLRGHVLAPAERLWRDVSVSARKVASNIKRKIVP